MQGEMAAKKVDFSNHKLLERLDNITLCYHITHY